MSKLTENQMAVLASSNQRADGAMTPPPMLKGAALAKISKELRDRKLAREIRAKDDMPVWRRDDGERSYGLVVTAAGRKTVNAEDAVAKAVGMPECLPSAVDSARPSAQMASAIQETDKSHEAIAPSTAAPTTLILSDVRSEAGATPCATALKAAKKEPRSGTKQALVIEMLNRPNGAGIAELIIATDWLAHTTRAMITGLRKRGYLVERVKDDDQTSRYRILGRTESPAGDGAAPPTTGLVAEGA